MNLDSHLDFQLFFNSLPGAFLVLTPELILVAISDELLTATMIKREHILGRYVFDVLPDDPQNPSGFQIWKASLEKVLKTRKPDTMPLVKYSIKRPDNEGGEFAENFGTPAIFLCSERLTAP